MKEENYQKAKELKSKIERKQDDIHRIQSLEKSCGLQIKIEGTAHGAFRKVDYFSNNKEAVKRLLYEDKLKLENEIKELQTEFDNL